MKVTVKLAQTLDGKSATRTGASKWITGKTTRDWARRQRARFDAILVGIETVLADNPSLHASPRTCALKPPRAKLLRGARQGQCLLVTTAKAPKKRIAAWEKKGVSVLVAPTKAGRISWKWLLRQLPKYGIKTMLVEGGPTVVGSALKEGIAAEAHIYMAPKVLGDSAARSSVEGLNRPRLKQAVRFKNLRFKKVGKDIFIQAHVYRTH